MSEQINVATVGAPATKIVVDAPPKPSAEPVDATGAPKSDAAGGSATAAPAAVVPPGQDAKDPNLGRAFAALAKKDEAIRNREKQVAEEGKQVKAVRDALETARSKKDPTALLELAGITPGELTDLLIALGKEPSEADRLAALEAARKADETKAATAAEQAEEAALQAQVRAYQANLATVAKGAPDKFELTLAKGADGIDLAWSIVDEEYRTKGRVMPYEEALSLAEGHYDSEAKQYLSTKKYGAGKPQSSSESTGARADTAPDVLTNNHVSGGPPAIKRTNLTRNESLAEAARLMESRGWGKTG